MMMHVGTEHSSLLTMKNAMISTHWTRMDAARSAKLKRDGHVTLLGVIRQKPLMKELLLLLLKTQTEQAS